MQVYSTIVREIYLLNRLTNGDLRNFRATLHLYILG